MKKVYASSGSEFNTSLILITGYLFISFLANLTVGKATPINDSLAIPIGSLLYAVSFTWIDLINDYLGKEKARKIVLAAVGANLSMILWFQLYITLPGSGSWSRESFAQNAIVFVMGGYWRIYAASLITSIVVENTDITLYHFIRWNKPNITRWLRSLLSNTVSAPLDAFLFSALAFYGTMPTQELISIILGGAIYKLTIAYVSIPLIYLVHARYERSQQDIPSENLEAIS